MAVYDALVRMAQDFTTLYRLVDGHGNFGSVDADPAAAMRYTECRLTPLATQTLLQDIAEDTVDFLPNFDGNEQEPTVLPSKLPLLLLNGSSGIAVGMATNIPPHNLREILSACKLMLRRERISTSRSQKEVSNQELTRLVPGPDFPTGASIMGTKDAQKLYETGNGGVIMRAVTHIESVGRRQAIIVTELPYQVNKAALLEQIAGLVNDKKLEGIADLRDESDREGIRVVLELKQRDVIPQVVLANLYKKTKLQSVFSGNFVALMKPKGAGVSSNSLTPQRFTLREALDYFLDFRFETIRRKTANQLVKVQARAHIVEGLLLALSMVDQVIDMIRTMPDQVSCREALMKESNGSDDGEDSLKLGLSREQADSVLRLQLGQLTRLNQGKLEEEKADLESQSENLQQLLSVDDAVYELMIQEFDEMDKKYGHDRKTSILNEAGEVNEIDLVSNARSVIVVTRGGYIKRMPLKTFESQGRGTRGKRGTSDALSKTDEILHCITCSDHDTLLMITQNGIAFGLPAYQVPSGTRTAKGTPLPSVLPIRIDDSVTTVLPVTEFPKDEYIVLTTEKGMIKKTTLDAFEKISSRGLMIATLNEGDKLKWCRRCTDHDDILLGSSGGMAVRFPAATLRPTGRSSRGVISMKLKGDDNIADMNVLAGRVNGDNDPSDEYVLCVTKKGYGKRVSTNDFPTTTRGKIGVIAIKFKKGMENTDQMSCFCVVKEDDEILVNTAKGIMVRQRVDQISRQSRSATGVMVQKVDESDSITSVSVVPIPEDEEIS
jgi:DNA gyrase subunit A